MRTVKMSQVEVNRLTLKRAILEDNLVAVAETLVEKKKKRLVARLELIVSQKGR